MKRHRSRYVAALAAVAVAACMLLGGQGCNWDPFDDTDPMPPDYPYHTHPAILRIHVANWELEPVGVESVAMFCSGAGTARPAWSFGVYYDSNVDFTLRRGCTTMVTCTTRVIHYAGYQRKHHGDTTRLGVLDDDPGWICRLALGGGHAFVPDGKSTIVRSASLCEIGDTLFPGAPWIVEAELDMSGLFTRDTGDMWDELVMHAEYTHGRQVRE